MIALGVAVAWAACGFVAYGISLAHMQREYPLIAEGDLASDRAWCAVTALLGPIDLLVVLVLLRPYHGFML